MVRANAAIGAREASGEWLAAFGARLLDVTQVASIGFAAVGGVAALYFAGSLSRPNRYTRSMTLLC